MRSAVRWWTVALALIQGGLLIETGRLWTTPSGVPPASAAGGAPGFRHPRAEDGLVPHLLIRQAGKPEFYVPVQTAGALRKTHAGRPEPGVAALLEIPGNPKRHVIVQGYRSGDSVRVRAWTAENVEELGSAEVCQAIQDGRVSLRLFFDKQGSIGQEWKVPVSGQQEGGFSIALVKFQIPRLPMPPGTPTLRVDTEIPGCCACGDMICCPTPGECVDCGGCAICCRIRPPK